MNLWEEAKYLYLLKTVQTSSDIPSNTIDYVFTDPPYSGRIQYGELNFLQEAILGMPTDWLRHEVIVNKTRGFSESTWQMKLESVMRELFRVVKPGHWISVCFHDSNPATWELLQDTMANVGFVPGAATEASSMETGWQTLKMHTSKEITKRDLVVNYYKPSVEERGIRIIKTDDSRSINEKVTAVIREVLEAIPGSRRDRVYDEIVSGMMTKGEMEAHNFDELLRSVAYEVKETITKNLFEKEDPNLFGTDEYSRWYLKDSQFALVDEAESAKEESAARALEAVVGKYLRNNHHVQGMHYSDLFENYVYAVKDKPRRQPGEWLLDYFYKAEDGTYRLPESEEEKKLKEEGRRKGINRRVKRYVAYIEHGVSIPDGERQTDATLAEWIRHCKRNGLYEYGKLLYERGGLNAASLSEEASAGVEEDYEVCVRKLGKV